MIVIANFSVFHPVRGPIIRPPRRAPAWPPSAAKRPADDGGAHGRVGADAEHGRPAREVDGTRVAQPGAVVRGPRTARAPRQATQRAALSLQQLLLDGPKILQNL